VIESLVMAGAFDEPGADRATLFAAVETAVEYAQASQRERARGQFSLFGGGADDSAARPHYPAATAWTGMETLINEKSVLGFWFSGHPLEKYVDDLRAFTTPLDKLAGRQDRAAVTVGGIITQVTRKNRKKDDKPFINIRLEDTTGSCAVIFMNGAFEEYKDRLAVDRMVIVEGTVKNDGSDQPSVFANAVEPLEDARTKRARAVNIAFSTAECGEPLLRDVLALLEQHPGNLPVWIDLRTATSGYYRLKSTRFQVSPAIELIRGLRDLLGADRVWIG
jgi:DNA polymerase-3 subunit alpha